MDATGQAEYTATQIDKQLTPAQWWEVAALARRLAARYCEHEGDQSCDWYHGLRPYWRALNLLADPTRHDDFFQSSLRPLASSGAFDRVLICGTADFTMPAMIVEAWAARGRTPRLSILDRCPTPLLLCRWYLRSGGIRHENILSDVRDYQSSQPFDLIVSHSFFPQFPPRERPAVIAAWQRLLRAGGKVITVTRIRARGEEEPGYIPLQQTEQSAFIERLRQVLRAGTVSVPVAEEELLNFARHYAASRRNYTVREPERLIDQMEKKGFQVTASEIGSGRSAAEEWRRDGVRPDAITYLALTATRTA